MLKRTLFTLLTPLFLSGCMGIYEGGFECPPGKGMGCTSISDVNKHINQTAKPPHCRAEECLCKEEEKLSRPQQDPQIWYSPWFIGSENQATPPLHFIPKNHEYGSI